MLFSFLKSIGNRVRHRQKMPVDLKRAPNLAAEGFGVEIDFSFAQPKIDLLQNLLTDQLQSFANRLLHFFGEFSSLVRRQYSEHSVRKTRNQKTLAHLRIFAPELIPECFLKI